MHSKSDNKSGEVIVKLFNWLLNKYQSNLETSMRGSDFIFDYVHLLYYKYHKINLDFEESYIDSLDWIKIKK